MFMTIEQLLKSDDTVSYLKLPDYKVIVFLLYKGSDKLKYYFFLNEKLLFSGNDYKPSPLYSIDGVESLVSLLLFLTLRKGDTDPEYFKNYTEEQLKWSESFDCEQLRIMVSDFDYIDTSEPEYHKIAREYFKDAYNS